MTLTPGQGREAGNERYQPFKIDLTHRDISQLFYWMRRQPFATAMRGLAIILWSQGLNQEQIATCTGLNVRELELFVRRYRDAGLGGLGGLRPTIPLSRLLNSRPAAAGNTLQPAEQTVSIASGTSADGSSPLNATASVATPETGSWTAQVPAVVPLSASSIVASGQAADMPEASSAPEKKLPDLWQDLEPDDPSDPIKPESSESVNGYHGWQLVGASCRGRLHRHEGKYREDAFEIRAAGKWHIAVVADGAGSAPLARVGAHMAASTAVATLARELPVSEPTAETVSKALLAAVNQARQALESEAQSRQAKLEALATTLLILVHRPEENGHWTAVFQVGDGAVTASYVSGEVKQLGIPDQGEFAGQTWFLTQLSETADIMERIYLSEPLSAEVELLLVMTDGVADDFFPPERELPLLIRHLRPALAVGGNASAERLLELLNYKKRGSFDDRTLVAIVAPTLLERAKCGL